MKKEDVLVCSGPKNLKLNNGGLSKALLSAAGREMQDELYQNYSNGVEYGGIATSRGYQLPCKFVYHGALQKWGTSQPDPLSTLEEFMMTCLVMANSHCRSSIAFPTLGLGFLDYPSDQVAKLMTKTIGDFSFKQSAVNIKDIVIVVFEEERLSLQSQTDLKTYNQFHNEAQKLTLIINMKKRSDLHPTGPNIPPT
ncbi:macro domain-containing protein PG1779-like [Saccostrea cucullata]|uniref:macro domain-containing protein PG1779-like n=1 Tax=Saccostrea cuccullata TaxID=36930 RepID=UPI002ECFE1F5